MTSTANQHGLSRDIPDPIKRIVRQECGFGCVECGASLVEYEHVQPEYRDAREHDPRQIALLCPTCHANVTRKLWSKERVIAARANPHCKQSGYSRGQFDFGNRVPAVFFAGSLFQNCPVPVRVGGTDLIRVLPPEDPSGVFRLSALFTDGRGTPILEIRDNEWLASADVWDFECVGGRMTVRQAQGKQCLVIRAHPPKGIAIERLHMLVNGVELDGDKEALIIRRDGGEMTLSGNVGEDCQVGLSL